MSFLQGIVDGFTDFMARIEENDKNEAIALVKAIEASEE